MTLFDEFGRVLAAAAHYSREKSPEMDDRQEALLAAKAIIEGWTRAGTVINGSHTTWEVEVGGRRGGIGPVPWVRVYSPDYSPRATDGFYVVFLFAADGSRVYLSLNHGTSEFRTGKMRPLRDGSLILERSIAARSLLSVLPLEWLEGLGVDIDLAVGDFNVGAESRKRIENYELANVYSISYDSLECTSDQALWEDLRWMLSLLETLYSVDGDTNASIFGTTLVASDDQPGRVRVPEVLVRRTLGNYALGLARRYLANTGDWQIEVVKGYRPYDLHLRSRKSGVDAQVIVRGSRSLGEVRGTHSMVQSLCGLGLVGRGPL